MAAALSLVATTVVCKVPALASAFDFSEISWKEYGIAILLAVLIIPVVEIVKLIQRSIHKK